MPHRINLSAEIGFAILTITSTMAWSDILIKVIVGVLTYFISRILYRLFKENIDRVVDKIKTKFL